MSFISNFGLTVRNHFFDNFTSNSAIDVFKNLIKQCLLEKLDFSEYQLFAYLNIKYKSTMGVANLKLFRRAGLLINNISQIEDIETIAKSLLSYDAISFENHHSNLVFGRLMARVALMINHSW